MPPTHLPRGAARGQFDSSIRAPLGWLPRLYPENLLMRALGKQTFQIPPRLLAWAIACCLVPADLTFADGKVVPPRDYRGSLEERAQEAIIIFHESKTMGEATEDLIIKIEVEGDASEFAWVVPLPNEPQVAKEDPRLFRELFNYVESRQRRRPSHAGSMKNSAEKADNEEARPVTVLQRKIVGDYDVAIVRENLAGGLNPWLEENGYQSLDDAEDVLAFYRDKNYVYACVKVASPELASEDWIDSHPLRFSFKTGGRDGIYFPMKMTGLQTQPFDVNLYVFYRFWINDKKSRFGYAHRGFRMRYRDWDSSECEPDGGKAYSLPEEDPFLRNMAHHLPTVTALFQKLHPGAKYYLTNIQAAGLNPADVRDWRDDLWLFPYYRSPDFVPYDVRGDGISSAAYPHAESDSSSSAGYGYANRFGLPAAIVGVAAFAMIAGVLVFRHLRNRAETKREWEQFEKR